VTLNGETLLNWNMCISGPLFDKAPNKFTQNQLQEYIQFYSSSNSNSHLFSFDPNAPNIYTGTFSVPDKTPSDTFLLPMVGSNNYWHKGVAYVNEQNLGRYWPVMGPQVTLYTPGVWLNPSGDNSLTMIELLSSACGNEQTCSLQLVDYPILDKKTTLGAPALFKRNL